LDIGMEKTDERQIGPYTLIRQLGQGGLGVVWEAEQKEPVQRTVAIKLIRAGLELRADVVARFHQERRSLARMEHPHIAALYDAGTTVEGSPYFVMELVRGQTLTEYCTQKKLSRQDKLAIFITMCDAVQHAHQKGILHRDLKPSNVLVTEIDGQPAPKVIDFGIARLLDSEEDDVDVFKTRIGDLPSATYPYLSPEQATRGEQDIDTRSDVYTLGVMLYELVTGRLPLPVELIRSGDFEAIARFVREEDAPAANTRSELDWIIVKAMAKAPAERYQSASALADDLRRFLADDVVTARPPAAGYLLKKWLKKHRTAVTTLGLVMLSLAVGLFFALQALQRERQAVQRESAQRQIAETASQEAIHRAEEAVQARRAADKSRQAAEQARTTADTARARAETLINDMLFDMRDSLESIGRSDLLMQVSASAEKYFAQLPPASDNESQHRNRAAMHQNRGHVLMKQGLYAQAAAQFDTSLTLTQQLVKQDPKSVRHLHDLALACECAGSAQEALGNKDQARTHYQEMERVFSHLQPQSKALEVIWRQDVSVAHERLGDLARDEGKLDEATKHFQAGMDQLLPLEEKPIVLRRRAVLTERLGSMAELQSDLGTAQKHYETALGLWQKLVRTARNDLNLIAAEATASGKLIALQLAQPKTTPELLTQTLQAVATFERLHQRDNMNVAWANGLAIAQMQHGAVCEAQNKHVDAETAFVAALNLFSQQSGSQQQAAAAQLRVGISQLRQGNRDAGLNTVRVAQERLKALPRSTQTDAWLHTAEELLNNPPQ
jgi:eukaryotic-like serine/threonine-protein kinase